MASDPRLPADAAPVPPPLPSWHRVFDRTEGRVLAVGLAMCLGLAVGVGIGLLAAPDATMKAAAVIGLSLVIGIAAGISYGYAAGFGPAEVIALNVLVESLQVLIVYPLFVLAWQQLFSIGRIAPMLERLREAAQARQATVRRWGMVGLFAFVFIPFWMTGPIVGAIIGFLLGLSAALNLAIVLTASALSVIVYAVALEHLTAWGSQIHPYVVFGGILALLLCIWIAQRLLRRPAGAPGAAGAPDVSGNP